MSSSAPPSPSSSKLTVLGILRKLGATAIRRIGAVYIRWVDRNAKSKDRVSFPDWIDNYDTVKDLCGRVEKLEQQVRQRLVTTNTVNSTNTVRFRGGIGFSTVWTADGLHDGMLSPSASTSRTGDGWVDEPIIGKKRRAAP